MSAGDAEGRGGVDDEEAVATALHKGYMGILSGRLLHRLSHTAGVAHKEQVAALKAIPLRGCSATAKR